MVKTRGVDLEMDPRPESFAAPGESREVKTVKSPLMKGG